MPDHANALSQLDAQLRANVDDYSTTYWRRVIVEHVPADQAQDDLATELVGALGLDELARFAAAAVALHALEGDAAMMCPLHDEHFPHTPTECARNQAEREAADV